MHSNKALLCELVVQWRGHDTLCNLSKGMHTANCVVSKRRANELEAVIDEMTAQTIVLQHGAGSGVADCLICQQYGSPNEKCSAHGVISKARQ